APARHCPVRSEPDTGEAPLEARARRRTRGRRGGPVSELALLARAFEAVPEPDEQTVAGARAALLDAIVSKPRPARLRLALFALALVLVLAGIATAAYVGVRSWVSSGPRGPQYSSGYRLATVFSPGRPGLWSDFALDPNGHDLYALHWPSRRATIPVLVRISGVDRGSRPRATRVLDLRQLPPGFHTFAGTSPYAYGFWVPEYTIVQRLSVAPNGDLFVVAAGTNGVAV